MWYLAKSSGTLTVALPSRLVTALPPMRLNLLEGAHHRLLVVRCGGHNDRSHLGDGTTTERHDPVRVQFPA